MRYFNFKNIPRLDREDMLIRLMEFPSQCQSALELVKDTEITVKKKFFRNIIFLGMGGSAIGGDLVRSYLYSELDIPVIVIREYTIPRFLDKESLVFVSSYSGNTEETLSAYTGASKRKAAIVAISSGGKLKELCSKNKDIFIQIPEGFPPRCALGYLSLIPLKVLEKIKIISSRQDEFQETISVLNDLKEYLNPSVKMKDNLAKSLASMIYNKIPLIYTASLNFDVVASRFRTQLNENAKILAMSNFFPEMNHNEIEGLINSKKIFKHLIAIFIKDKGFHLQVKKRIEITAQIMKNKGIPIFELNSKGEYLLARIFSLIYMVDFISFYLAILYNTNPTPVEIISFLKDKLKK
ncbi:MAG: bifunctional phosphoglucose/phosphomannose isomerase [Candidatus Omnitrophica bacterium]|nr:bifunctional phosphoglucose/phosphomannose isomerase [Candidatus Omnitrophota bacterium]